MVIVKLHIMAKFTTSRNSCLLSYSEGQCYLPVFCQSKLFELSWGKTRKPTCCVSLMVCLKQPVISAPLADATICSGFSTIIWLSSGGSNLMEVTVTNCSCSLKKNPGIDVLLCPLCVILHYMAYINRLYFTGTLTSV